ncbi:uncharacterized protein LOC134227334 [Armigeres subalbatus]|uniref:uncharacterized protein LOC134227334 n=1 Tax=Armigeres subalbatus TaxID=124917 RepID=UPI002ED50C6D
MYQKNMYVKYHSFPSLQFGIAPLTFDSALISSLGWYSRTRRLLAFISVSFSFSHAQNHVSLRSFETLHRSSIPTSDKRLNTKNVIRKRKKVFLYPFLPDVLTLSRQKKRRSTFDCELFQKDNGWQSTVQVEVMLL